MRKRSAPGATADHDDVVMIHGFSMSIVVANNSGLKTRGDGSTPAWIGGEHVLITIAQKSILCAVCKFFWSQCLLPCGYGMLRCNAARDDQHS